MLKESFQNKKMKKNNFDVYECLIVGPFFSGTTYLLSQNMFLLEKFLFQPDHLNSIMMKLKLTNNLEKNEFDGGIEFFGDMLLDNEK